MAHIASGSFRKTSLKHVTVLATIAALASMARSPTLAQRADSVVRPKQIEVDWPAAARDALALSPDLAAPPAKSRAPAEQRSRATKRLQSYVVKEGMEPLANLSEYVSPYYPAAADAPVPVLAPVDPTQLLRRQPPGAKAQARARSASLGPSITALDMVSDAAGYEMAATVSAGLLNRLGITARFKPQLFIGGSSVTYSDRQAGELVADMQNDIQGLRRIEGPEEVTYVYRKYGVPYFVSLDCTRTGEKDVLTCTQADAIVREILKSLRLIGGGPRAMEERRSAATPPSHPTKVDPHFTYHRPGKLLEGTAETKSGGVAHQQIYGNDAILFPLKDVPAFANSQVFMHGGNCFSTPGTQDKMVFVAKKPGDRFKRYHCIQNTKELLLQEGNSENYSYPWSDNVCEVRNDAGPGECPLSKGHAGQDIRPTKCVGQPAKCPIDLYEVLAVTKGSALWKKPPYENHLRLRADDGTGLYYMYLHMSPDALKGAGMKKGQYVAVWQGKDVGKVGNFEKALPGRTTAHLHFEIRRPPADMPEGVGPSLAPYYTLIRAYERRLSAIGTEVP
jgi:hypothetical protein